mmetsp:Transcript_21957/g.61036  ORF Transcript_21957/g.61036 Transcript_21957/m.61036 type:complete len:3067 (+) Transcript_21957:267-9467(+)
MMATSKVGGEISRTKKLIKSALIGAGLTSIDGSVLSKCVALASTLGLSPETMAEVWEAHSLNKQNLTELTMHQFEAYKNELIKASSAVPIPPVTTSTSTSSNANTDSPRGAIGISRKDTAALSSAKRGAQRAPMVTPTSSSKRPKHEFEQEHEQRQGSLFGDLGSGSAVDTAASDAVPSPLRSNARAGTVQQQQQQQQQQQKRQTQTQRPKPNLPKYDERTNAGQVVASYPSDRSKFQAEASSEGTERSRCVLTTTSIATKKSASTSTSTSASASASTSNGTTKETADVTIYNVTKPYRHMFTTMEDRALALEKHLVRIREAIESDIDSDKTGNKEKHEHAPLEEVNVPRQDPSTFVGRICNEAHTGRLNATSVVLEGSSTSCGGARVNVDLSKIQPEQNPKGYSLFPGQIVALEGMNGTGRKITVSKLREGTSLPPASSSVCSLRNYYKTTGRKAAPLKIVSACGPFTTSDSNEYAPFIDLMGVVIDEQPDLVILKGPFVDVRQEAVKSGAPTVPGPDGEMDRPMVVDHETIFAQNISLVIEEFFEQQQGSNSNNKTQFVLVPALEDATGKGVYPQPPLQDRFSDGASRFLDIPGAESIAFGSSGLYELTNAKASPDGLQRVHCLSNPCTFRVNELVVGVTSTDVLFHTSVEETHAHLPVGSRMRRMAQHLVSQQSYYPLFPPHKSVNLDLKQQDQFRMPCRPDILLVPSRLAPFCAPILGTTMAINPGHLSKGTTGGTYAILTIRPMDEKKVGGNETNNNSSSNNNKKETEPPKAQTEAELDKSVLPLKAKADLDLDKSRLPPTVSSSSSSCSSSLATPGNPANTALRPSSPRPQSPSTTSACSKNCRSRDRSIQNHPKPPVGERLPDELLRHKRREEILRKTAWYEEHIRDCLHQNGGDRSSLPPDDALALELLLDPSLREPNHNSNSNSNHWLRGLGWGQHSSGSVGSDPKQSPRSRLAFQNREQLTDEQLEQLLVLVERCEQARKETAEMETLRKQKESGIEIDMDRLYHLQLRSRQRLGEVLEDDEKEELLEFEKQNQRQNTDMDTVQLLVTEQDKAPPSEDSFDEGEFDDLLSQKERGEAIDENRLYELELRFRKKCGEHLTQDEEAELEILKMQRTAKAEGQPNPVERSDYGGGDDNLNNNNNNRDLPESKRHPTLAEKVAFEKFRSGLKKKGLPLELSFTPFGDSATDNDDDNISALGSDDIDDDTSYVHDLVSQKENREADRKEECLEDAYEIYQETLRQKGLPENEALLLEIFERLLEETNVRMKGQDEAFDVLVEEQVKQHQLRKEQPFQAAVSGGETAVRELTLEETLHDQEVTKPSLMEDATSKPKPNAAVSDEIQEKEDTEANAMAEAEADADVSTPKRVDEPPQIPANIHITTDNNDKVSDRGNGTENDIISNNANSENSIKNDAATTQPKPKLQKKGGWGFGFFQFGVGDEKEDDKAKDDAQKETKDENFDEKQYNVLIERMKTGEFQESDFIELALLERLKQGQTLKEDEIEELKMLRQIREQNEVLVIGPLTGSIPDVGEQAQLGAEVSTNDSFGVPQHPDPSRDVLSQENQTNNEESLVDGMDRGSSGEKLFTNDAVETKKLTRDGIAVGAMFDEERLKDLKQRTQQGELNESDTYELALLERLKDGEVLEGDEVEELNLLRQIRDRNNQGSQTTTASSSDLSKIFQPDPQLKTNENEILEQEEISVKDTCDQHRVLEDATGRDKDHKPELGCAVSLGGNQTLDEHAGHAGRQGDSQGSKDAFRDTEPTVGGHLSKHKRREKGNDDGTGSSGQIQESVSSKESREGDNAKGSVLTEHEAEKEEPDRYLLWELELVGKLRKGAHRSDQQDYELDLLMLVREGHKLSKEQSEDLENFRRRRKAPNALDDSLKELFHRSVSVASANTDVRYEIELSHKYLSGDTLTEDEEIELYLYDRRRDGRELTEEDWEELEVIKSKRIKQPGGMEEISSDEDDSIYRQELLGKQRLGQRLSKKEFLWLKILTKKSLKEELSENDLNELEIMRSQRNQRNEIEDEIVNTKQLLEEEMRKKEKRKMKEQRRKEKEEVREQMRLEKERRRKEREMRRKNKRNGTANDAGMLGGNSNQKAISNENTTRNVDNEIQVIGTPMMSPPPKKEEETGGFFGWGGKNKQRQQQELEEKRRMQEELIKQQMKALALVEEVEELEREKVMQEQLVQETIEKQKAEASVESESWMTDSLEDLDESESDSSYWSSSRDSNFDDSSIESGNSFDKEENDARPGVDQSAAQKQEHLSQPIQTGADSNTPKPIEDIHHGAAKHQKDKTDISLGFHFKKAKKRGHRRTKHGDEISLGSFQLTKSKEDVSKTSRVTKPSTDQGTKTYHRPWASDAPGVKIVAFGNPSAAKDVRASTKKKKTISENSINFQFHQSFISKIAEGGPDEKLQRIKSLLADVVEEEGDEEEDSEDDEFDESQQESIMDLAQSFQLARSMQVANKFLGRLNIKIENKNAAFDDTWENIVVDELMVAEIKQRLRERQRLREASRKKPEEKEKEEETKNLQDVPRLYLFEGEKIEVAAKQKGKKRKKKNRSQKKLDRTLTKEFRQAMQDVFYSSSDEEYQSGDNGEDEEDDDDSADRRRPSRRQSIAIDLYHEDSPERGIRFNGVGGDRGALDSDEDSGTFDGAYLNRLQSRSMPKDLKRMLSGRIMAPPRSIHSESSTITSETTRNHSGEIDAPQPRERRRPKRKKDGELAGEDIDPAEIYKQELEKRKYGKKIFTVADLRREMEEIKRQGDRQSIDDNGDFANFGDFGDFDTNSTTPSSTKKKRKKKRATIAPIGDLINAFDRPTTGLRPGLQQTVAPPPPRSLGRKMFGGFSTRNILGVGGLNGRPETILEEGDEDEEAEQEAILGGGLFTSSENFGSDTPIEHPKPAPHRMIANTMRFGGSIKKIKSKFAGRKSGTLSGGSNGDLYSIDESAGDETLGRGSSVAPSYDGESSEMSAFDRREPLPLSEAHQDDDDRPTDRRTVMDVMNSGIGGGKHLLSKWKSSLQNLNVGSGRIMMGDEEEDARPLRKRRVAFVSDENMGAGLSGRF